MQLTKKEKSEGIRIEIGDNPTETRMFIGEQPITAARRLTINVEPGKPITAMVELLRPCVGPFAIDWDRVTFTCDGKAARLLRLPGKSLAGPAPSPNGWMTVHEDAGTIEITRAPGPSDGPVVVSVDPAVWNRFMEAILTYGVPCAFAYLGRAENGLHYYRFDSPK